VSEYHDTAGRTLRLDSTPARIVSLVPSITEALFIFGAGDSVAGVTRFCVEPTDVVRDLPKVGGTKDVDVNAVRRLDPDLVIANQEENTREDVEWLIAAGLPVFLTYPRTVAAAIEELKTLAAITGTETTARTIISDATEALAAAKGGPRQTVKVFCPIWRRPWMTIGPDTYVHDMIRVCGGRNVFADSTERYPVTTLEDVAHRGPRVVLLPDEPYHFQEKHREEVIAALGPDRIHYVDGKALCWYGPRIGPAIRLFNALLRETGPEL
jgi:ABC-type Fe3+-hydroxamate transport system substrate-binding protein